MAWDRYTNGVGLIGLTGFQPPPPPPILINGSPPATQVYTNDKTCTDSVPVNKITQSRKKLITTSMMSTIAGSINARS